MRSLLIGTLLVALGFRHVHAETVVVPLPDVLGHYHRYAQSGSETFTLPREPIAIQGVRIHLKGDATSGSAACEFTPVLWPTSFTAAIDGSQCVAPWTASAPAPLGSNTVDAVPFDLVIDFVDASGNGTWDCLADGTELLVLDVKATLPSYCTMVVWPQAHILEAELLVDGEFVVSVSGSSWGRVKASYAGTGPTAW